MKFGIVGTNFVSDFFMNASKLVKDCEVVSVCSLTLEEAQKFADKYGIPNAYGSYQEMYESHTIDAVYLAVPNGLHKELSFYFLNRKIPVICEKPFGSNADEVREMVACARENQTYLQDAIVPLYTENFWRTKEALPKVGRLRRAIICFGKYSSRYDAYLRGENPTTFRRELSNGSTMDLGVYAISDAIALFGKPKKIYASGILLETGVDALGTAIFTYDDFEVVIMHSKVTDTVMIPEIQGEDGNIYIDLLSRFNEVWYVDRKTKEKEMISKDWEDNMSWEIQDFCDNVKAGRIESVKVPHQLSIDIHEVITECRRQMGVVYPADEK
ncbi:MAG: Gfo/Idh/MocA family oxidoreductase [Erysipelotrichaceae bacterium]|nr:Gfo/Idh/MocA family oxidoreductase [Erysipelotrichaceae bacterium]